MSVETNLTFVLGETWEVDFDLNDDAGEDLDLTAGSVAFRLSRRGVLQFELTSSGDDVVVESPSNGRGTITVPPEEQEGIFAAVYSYEVRVTLFGGVVTTQNTGSVTVSATLF